MNGLAAIILLPLNVLLLTFFLLIHVRSSYQTWEQERRWLLYGALILFFVNLAASAALSFVL